MTITYCVGQCFANFYVEYIVCVLIRDTTDCEQFAGQLKGENYG